MSRAPKTHQRTDKATTITDEGSLHKYRTEIPNTVVRGIKSRGLSIYAKWLYVYLKSVSGDNGVCFRSTTTLALEAGMSRGQVSEAKKELLHAKLIKIHKGHNPRRDADHIRIVDLWPANMQEFSVHNMNTDEDDGGEETQGVSSLSVHNMNTQYERSVHNMNSSVHNMNSSVHNMNQRRSHEEDPMKKKRSLPSVEPDLHAAEVKVPTKGKPTLARSRFLPDTFAITDELRQWAHTTVPTVDIDTETAKMRDHEYRDPRGDWVRAWRNWMRRASEQPRHGRHPPGTAYLSGDALTKALEEIERHGQP